ncbi:MAG: hypothetical protein AAGC60_11715 [Acidobacteriota bacterium]
MTLPSNDQHRLRARRGARGFSLVELIFSTFLILIVAVGILPLFMRAIQNNVSGGDSSDLITILRSGNESMSFSSLSDLHLGDQEAVASDSMFLEIPFTVLHTGARDPITGNDQTIGDEEWVADGDPATGLGTWQRSTRIFFHPIADVMPGIVSVGADTGGATFETVGHPQLFDDPIPVAQAQSEFNNLVRIEIEVESTQQGADGSPIGGPVKRYKEMAVSRVRVF